MATSEKEAAFAAHLLTDMRSFFGFFSSHIYSYAFFCTHITHVTSLFCFRGFSLLRRHSVTQEVLLFDCHKCADGDNLVMPSAARQRFSSLCFYTVIIGLHTLTWSWDDVSHEYDFFCEKKLNLIVFLFPFIPFFFFGQTNQPWKYCQTEQKANQKQ